MGIGSKFEWDVSITMVLNFEKMSKNMSNLQCDWLFDMFFDMFSKFK